MATITRWLFKSAHEIVATPLTYATAAFLKRHEGLDAYDRKARFNPLPSGNDPE